MSPEEEEQTSRSGEIVRFVEGAPISLSDRVAHEEPLEIQIQGASLAVLMRTPGRDLELVLGFLLTEGIIQRASDVASIRHCTSVKSPEAEENIVRVVLREDLEVPLSRLRGSGFASTSCGLCGKATIESTLVSCAPLIEDGAESSAMIGIDCIYRMPEKLRAHQATFDATGGLHAAALFGRDGEILFVREDVGRHNATDKVIGALYGSRDRARDDAPCLLVSGRTSFEIIQKAAVARIPIVLGIGAPTSLAVAFAREVGVTLGGFLRASSINVYSHAARIEASSTRTT